MLERRPRSRTKRGAPPKAVTKRTARRGEQLEIAPVVESTGKRNWGGRREGAGRKRGSALRRVEHRTRPVHKRRHPVHVTLRLRGGLPSLRHQRVLGMLRSVLLSQTRRAYANDFHVAQFSVQTNHVHMIVEAEHRDALRAGVSGFAIAFARRLNMMLRRKGKVWGDRWHGRALATPIEVRNALVYLFRNFTRHGELALGHGVTDFYSSAPRFDGWTEPIPTIDPAHARREGVTHFFLAHRWPPARARSWLLGAGWKKHGLVDPNELKRALSGTAAGSRSRRAARAARA